MIRLLPEQYAYKRVREKYRPHIGMLTHQYPSIVPVNSANSINTGIRLSW